MRLREGLILRDVGGDHVAVTVGEARKRFNGLMRNNDTADFIYRQLQSETTEEAIVEAMFEEYDAPREVIAADVHELLEQIRETGLLEE
ncbi:MAG: PqqD family protein [Lachnospiraceae bacterium]|nr:PqqD family protein [Lachnospiraceae bacterium]